MQGKKEPSWSILVTHYPEINKGTELIYMVPSNKAHLHSDGTHTDNVCSVQKHEKPLWRNRVHVKETAFKGQKCCSFCGIWKKAKSSSGKALVIFGSAYGGHRDPRSRPATAPHLKHSCALLLHNQFQKQPPTSFIHLQNREIRVNCTPSESLNKFLLN